MNFLSTDIVREWDLASLNPKNQKEAIEKIGKLLYQAILVKSLEILSATEEEELDSLLDNDKTSPRDVLLFLKSKIPTFDSLVRSQKEELKKELLD